MSFDLAVWHESGQISDSEAQATYEKLCEGMPLPASSRVLDFVTQLASRFPQIDDLDEDEVEDCPWTCEWDQSDGHCILNLRWDVVDTMVSEIVALADKCGIICYDPQNGKIINMGRL